MSQEQADAEDAQYRELARQAVARLTPDGIRRTKRIMKLGEPGRFFSDKVFKLFQEIYAEIGSEAAEEPGSQAAAAAAERGYQAAIDLFEQVLAVERTSKSKSGPPIKRKGPHNSYRDKRLLEIFEKYSSSPRMLAERLVDTPKGRAQWGVAGYKNGKDQSPKDAADRLLRRVKELKRKSRASAPRG
jgi:hypothetical protein